MASANPRTGLPGLDHVLRGLIPGDNIVWQVDSIEDYRPFLEPYCRAAIADGERLIYFRFAKHEPLIGPECGAEICELHPEDGFEQFITAIHRTIEQTGRGGYYVFDCLSDLAVDWYSDRMLGNFFRLTCPYLFDVEAIAYFAILKNYHSVHASGIIAETTQVLLDVYRHKGKLYIHPIKAQQRHSPTMYMLHSFEGETFEPVMESSTISEILADLPWEGSDPARTRLGVWNRAFAQAERLMDPVHGECPLGQAGDLMRRLLRMIVTRDERVLELAEKYFTLNDVLNIWRRMIGTGLIGGKSVGMLLARAILTRTDPRWKDLLEVHDSFYIGSDVFYTYLVQNGCWWLRQKQANPATFLEGAEEARRRILAGTFPEDVRKQFSDMLDYFGQYPIIVRSSSLLEDAFGNSFAGKYESVFCANQGSRDKRLEDFMSAVRTIYASTMSEKALRYRAQRGLLHKDEQMSLLVQRVSGAFSGHLFYPQVAGVGLSFNPYVWGEGIDPKAGMLRLVFGLGTRAVDRSDDDYTRVVALNDPERRPEASFDEVRRYTQRRVDTLDLAANRLVSNDFIDVANQSPGIPLEMFASRDQELERLAAETGRRDMFPWILTFERLLSQTDFPKDMRDMLQQLEKAYGSPVDVEFTANFFDRRHYKINLVQCRPLQVSADETAVTETPGPIDESRIVLKAHGAVIGHSRSIRIDRILEVVPSVYGQLPVKDRYSIARLIGQVMHINDTEPGNILIMGPGRWGTTTPSLGVPVSFAEINTASVLCEIVAMRDDLVPDVSLGTHFFNELVECDILYLALFPNRKDNLLNQELLASLPNRLADLIPSAANRADVVRVINAADLPDGATFRLHAENAKQEVICYVDQAR
ncbi:MAG TPA: PEP/pyruvate-binding domain-containing protein [Phycisphaerae bacterium]|nr:PEP/pyruvate-binding domain-containing protein [Phycisphaerae bacterium]HOJ73307.1 PEP/pyruvate-binding domain-containing protein [Phycisphaerae bacterium]HOM51127.1 PEP/pyruvate-binding domain-containing protein [Phycisphaerae bacterium]HON65269.1 PEP/pyruvate-binding domain-containing protein [Phycisphaerae bacterium]HOQ87656.1 PEP/pyruvate-binding domain-containing protein [Phycisphaerae bacterium]